MGFFGQATNSLSFCLSLLGTSFVIRNLGLRKALLLFPTLLVGAGALVYAYPSLELVFVMMLALKALSYALNNPCKELLYQPTSKAIKFKAKSWIDIFGQRGAKVRSACCPLILRPPLPRACRRRRRHNFATARSSSTFQQNVLFFIFILFHGHPYCKTCQALGSVVTNFYAESATLLLSNGMIISMGLSGLLLYVSNWMGGKFEQYTETGTVVGDEAQDNGKACISRI